MQKIPALFKIRQEQGKVGSERLDSNQKNTRICALLTEKKNSQRLYNSVVDDEYVGQDKHTINILLNTR